MMNTSGLPASRRSTLVSRPMESRMSIAGGEGGFGRTPQTARNMPSSVRRSSVFASSGRGRPSAIHGIYNGIQLKDPRPIRDKGFQSNCIRNIQEYLLQSRYPFPLTSKTLSSPTSKEFQSIFRFLIDNLIDNSGGWSKKFEDDVMMILKDLKYPGMENVSKTALTAPGAPQSWSGLLAMLNWLVEICRAHQTWNDGQCISDPILLDPRQLPADHPNLEDRMLWDFASKTYDQWFDGGAEEFPEAEHELELMYDRMAVTAVDESQKLETTFAKRTLELQQLHAQEPPLKKLENEYLQLMGDKTKFIAFIDLHKQKADKTKQAILKIKEAISGQEHDLEYQRAELARIEAAVSAQNLTPDEVNRMNHERESLNRSLDDLRTKIAEASQSSYDQEMLVTRSMDRFENLLADYTALCHQNGLLQTLPDSMSSSVSSTSTSPDINYQLEIDLGIEELSELKVFNHQMRVTIWQGLQALREKYRQEDLSLDHDKIALDDNLDRLNQQVERQKMEVGTLEVKLKSLHEQAQTTQNCHTEDSTNQNKIITHLESEITNMLTASQQGVSVTKSQLESTKIAFQELQHKTAILHESIQAQIVNQIDVIIKAKQHAANSLKSIKALAELQ
ncbi:uncharacterized protein L201_002081 [Kwoniella dendrophila CBS 6074]|uniref:Kinetochore protein NDC80 n=1 Tax=Kwoniella dendrophila CBS 6074 TaxID=1295534 RepID=A0AAX4JRK6_9TREE